MKANPLTGGPTESERGFLDEARRQLATRHEQIRHSLRQLDDGSGGIARVVLSLCGDLDHKILSVVGGLSARSDRTGESPDRDPVSREALLARLDTAVDRADAVLAVITPDRLREARRCPGLGRVTEGTVLTVILGALLDLAGHAQEIALLTRSRPVERPSFALPALAFSTATTS
jgi:hypothetical protein